jgi:hypothetical protein
MGAGTVQHILSACHPLTVPWSITIVTIDAVKLVVICGSGSHVIDKVLKAIGIPSPSIAYLDSFKTIPLIRHVSGVTGT